MQYEQVGLQSRQVGLRGKQLDLQDRQVGLQYEQVGLQGRQVGLQGQQLDLQGRQVDLQQRQADLQSLRARQQEQMWLANTIIQGTQAAVGLTQAAVRLGQAFGDLHQEQANLDIQTFATAYQAGVTEAITNGYDPYIVETLENGQQVRRYIGYDNYELADGTRLGQFKEQAVDTVGSRYWTESGIARGRQIAANAFENIELAAQRQTADAVIKNRQDVFNQELTNAIREAQATGDFTQVEAVINGASWMPDDQKEATGLSAVREVDYGTALNEAIRIGVAGGSDKAGEYLASINTSPDDTKDIMSTVSSAISESLRGKKDAASRAYDETGGSIGQKTAAAIGNETNPQVREVRTSVARAKQGEDLIERFSKETAGYKTLDQLKDIAEKLKDGGAWEADYDGKEYLRKQQLSEVQRRIDDMITEYDSTAKAQGKAAAAEEAAIKNDVNNTLDLMMSEWRAPDGGYDGRRILEFMIGNEDYINPATKQKYEKELFGEPALSSEYAQLDSLLKSQKPDKKAGATEIAAYAGKEYEIKAALIDARMKGANSQQMREMINGFIKTESSDLVTKAFEKGQLNTGGLFGNAEKTEAELLYAMNQGYLDAYFGERTRSDLSTEEFIVGNDEKVNAVMAELSASGRTFLNRTLSAEGITVSDAEMTEKAKGDRDGALRYKGSDGNYYRVNVNGPKDKRFVEKWNTGSGKWEPYTPKKTAKPPASGGDYRRLGLDGVKTGYH